MRERTRAPMRCTCITRPESEGSITAAPSCPAAAAAAAAAAAMLLPLLPLPPPCLLVVSYSYSYSLLILIPSIGTGRWPSDCWNADAGFSLLVLKIIVFDDLSCISDWL